MPESLSTSELRNGNGSIVVEHRHEFQDGSGCNFYDEGSGEALVVLPGLLAGKDSFECQIRDFAVLLRVLVVEMFSGNYASTVTTLDRFAGRLLELLDQRGVMRASLVGHALGGSLAVVFAAKYPDRVIRLVLSNPVTRLAGVTLRERLHRRLDRLAVQLMRSNADFIGLAHLNRSWQRLGLAGASRVEPSVAGYLIPKLQNGLGELLLNRAPRLKPFDLRPLFTQLSLPALCIAGEHAPDADNLAALTSANQKWRFFSIAGAALLSYLSHPAQFNALVLSWLLREVETSRDRMPLRPRAREFAERSAGRQP